jgi:flagellar biosynthesis/type III secretory pathway M-ring protein FliF/YscJ
MIANMFDNLVPILIAAFLAACILWLAWRALRRLFRSPERRQEPQFATAREPTVTRQEPVVQSMRAPAPAVPDAADVLALKAAIDNLARQVATLEKRLASGPAGMQAAVQAAPAERTNERVPEVSKAPPVVPDRRI